MAASFSQIDGADTFKSAPAGQRFFRKSYSALFTNNSQAREPPRPGPPPGGRRNEIKIGNERNQFLYYMDSFLIKRLNPEPDPLLYRSGGGGRYFGPPFQAAGFPDGGFEPGPTSVPWLGQQAFK